MKTLTQRIKYLEKPATRDEKEVASLLERLVEVTECGNVTDLSFIFADAAKIVESDDGQPPLTKQVYIAQAAERLHVIRRVYFTDVLIRVIGDNAKIFSVRNVLFRNTSLPVSHKRLLTCRKDVDRWLIWSASPM